LVEINRAMLGAPRLSLTLGIGHVAFLCHRRKRRDE